MDHIPTNLFGDFTYVIPRDALGTAILAKIDKLRAKVAERAVRIDRIRQENKITDAILVDLLRQAKDSRSNNATYYSVSQPQFEGKNSSELVVGAGVLASLQAENDAMDKEKKSISRLERVERNLAYIKGDCTLSYEELQFLDL